MNTIFIVGGVYEQEVCTFGIILFDVAIQLPKENSTIQRLSSHSNDYTYKNIFKNHNCFNKPQSKLSTVTCTYN